MVELVPVQTEADPAMEPPTEAGSTVTVASEELAGEHVPLVTTARYFVIAVRSVAVSETVVLAISADVDQLSVLDCHLVTDPVYPERVKVVLLVPVQTEAPPDIIPPMDAGSTLRVISWVNVALQLGEALVVAMPVMRSVCPLLAAVRLAEAKLAAPEALATTAVTAVCATPPMVYETVEVLFASNPVKLIVAADPAHTVAAWEAPDKVGFGLTVTFETV